MSANATTTIWKVEIATGNRSGEWLFTSARAAKGFANTARVWIDNADVSVEEWEIYKSATAALFSGWPFDELRLAAEKR